MDLGLSPVHRRSQIHSTPTMWARVARNEGKLLSRGAWSCSRVRAFAAPNINPLAQEP
jgi:hypothetical protein